MKKILLTIAVLGCCPSLWAQRTTTQSSASPAVAATVTDQSVASGIRERLHVSTDKDNYLSGEIVWMKLLTTDDAGVPLSFSRIGYVELAGESGSVARERIDIAGGTGQGTMVLPSTLPTGYYRLVGYTRWMRNEGPAVFFEKRIAIVNPAVAEVVRGSGADEGAVVAGEASSVVPGGATDAGGEGSVRIRADRSSYATRSAVHLSIEGLPADVHTLSVSVAAADPLGGFTDPGLARWKTSLDRIPNTAPDEALLLPQYEAEYEGATITGQLVATDTGKALYSPWTLPLVSFPGEGINLFSGVLDSDGRVVFQTSHTNGFNEIVTTMRREGDTPSRIDLDDPFTEVDLARPMATLPIGQIDPQAVMDQSLAMQLQYAYVNDSLTRVNRTAPRFFERPDFVYHMEEWRRFATMREVMTEFIKLVQFFRADGKWNIGIFNKDFGTDRTASLVLIDGIPVFDHTIVHDYNPLLIERIDVYLDRYMLGNNLFFGIVAMYTEGYRYPELKTDPFAQIVAYPSPQAHRVFYSPVYADRPASEPANRLPDWRHTLYWNADVAVEDDGRAGKGGRAGEGGRADVDFFTSDLRGTYRVVVEGITRSGSPFAATLPLEVR
jgi:hypothetical protein